MHAHAIHMPEQGIRLGIKEHSTWLTRYLAHQSPALTLDVSGGIGCDDVIDCDGTCVSVIVSDCG